MVQALVVSPVLQLLFDLLESELHYHTTQTRPEMFSICLLVCLWHLLRSPPTITHKQLGQMPEGISLLREMATQHSTVLVGCLPTMRREANPAGNITEKPGVGSKLIQPKPGR